MIGLIAVILSISVILQCTAAIMAVRLIRLTRRHLAWILIVIALFLMEIRRCVPLFHIILGREFPAPDLLSESIALATSGFLVAGLVWIAPLFIAMRRSEQALRESREWLFTTLKSIGDAVIATDTKGIITFLNPTAQYLLGYNENEAEGKPLQEIFSIVDEETGHPLDNPVSKALQKNTMVGLEDHTLLISKTGRKLAIDDSAAPIKDEDGQVVGVVLVFRDITERRRAEESVLAAHRELDSIFNTAADGMRLIDSNHNVLRVNDRFAALLNMDKKEILGKKCYEVFHGPFCHTDNCPMLRIEAGEDNLEYDVDKELLDGSKISCIMTANSLREANGSLIGLVENFKDITQRKKTEELLRRAKMVIENSPTVLFRWRAEEGWPVEFVSENITQFGYNPDEIISGQVSFQSIISPQDRLRVLHEIEHGLPLGGVNLHQEYQIITKEGLFRSIQAQTYAEYTPDHKLSHYQAILIDITERKQAEEACKFKKEQERLSSILDGNPIPTFVIDQNHAVVYWNRACEILTGVKKETTLGKVLDSGIFYAGLKRPLLADCVLDMNLAEMEKLYQEKSLTQNSSIPEAFEAQDFITIGNVQRKLYFLAARLVDSKGQVVGAIETIQDNTERDQLERQLLHAQKMEAIGRLAGGVAHDFNNLLVVIRGYSEYLLSHLDEQAPMRKELEVIKKTGDRAASLTRRLLAFSRRQVLEPKVLDLNALVLDMEKMFRRIIGEDIQLVTKLGPEPIKVKADPGQIEQVIMNLVVNARDAMPEGGQLTIATCHIAGNYIPAYAVLKEPKEKYAAVSITDTGLGMNKEVMNHLFEPFFSTKGPGKGTGLGLSTVYGIVEQHQGGISIESEIGRGSTFFVYLPALSLEEREANLPLPSYVENKGHGEAILLVEDDAEVGEFSAKILRENGYAVFKANNADEAMAIFEKENRKIDLVFCDVVLPGKNGLDLVDQLLRLKQPQPLRVLLCSGYADDKSHWSVISKRSFRFLKKPYQLADLLQEIKKALKAEP